MTPWTFAEYHIRNERDRHQGQHEDEHEELPIAVLSTEENCKPSDRKHIECLRACLKGAPLTHCAPMGRLPWSAVATPCY